MKLDFVLVDNSELSFNVQKEVITIGRSPQCDVVIPHEGMSRKHCQITYKDGDLFIEDLGSVNGVYVDGTKISPNTPTKFQIFLNVAFGAVQNLKIELDDVTKVTTLPGSIAATTAPHSNSTQTATKLALAANKTGKIKKPSQMESSGPKKVAKKEKKSNSMMIILILVAVIGVAAYFFMGQEEVPAGPTPEQIYE